jgi:hypothetical protein
MVNDLCKTWNELGTKYPEVAASIRNLGGHTGLRYHDKLPEKRFTALGKAYFAHGTLALNDSYSEDSLEYYQRNAVEIGFHPQGTGAKGQGFKSTVVHEFGHFVSQYTSLKHIPQAIESVRSSAPAGLREKSVKAFTENNLSKYATTNADETFAEAFTEYHMSPKPRALATAIIEQSFDAIWRTEWKRDGKKWGLSSVSKARKRKYGSRREAAQAAARARWGNRSSGTAVNRVFPPDNVLEALDKHFASVGMDPGRFFETPEGQQWIAQVAATVYPDSDSPLESGEASARRMYLKLFEIHGERLKAGPEVVAAREKRLLEIVGSQPVVINMSDESFPSLINDGRFKSQFETNTSTGTLDPGARRITE